MADKVVDRDGNPRFGRSCARPDSLAAPKPERNVTGHTWRRADALLTGATAASMSGRSSSNTHAGKYLSTSGDEPVHNGVAYLRMSICNPDS